MTSLRVFDIEDAEFPADLLTQTMTLVPDWRPMRTLVPKGRIQAHTAAN